MRALQRERGRTMLLKKKRNSKRENQSKNILIS